MTDSSSASPHAPGTPLPVRKHYALYVLFMMVCLYTVNYIDRFLVAGLLDPIKQSLDVSNTFMGFLIGPAFAIFYTTLAIPIARLADRYSRIKIISIGTVVWSFFTVLSGYVTTPEAFAIARIGVGVGEAAFLAPAFSLLSDYYPPKRRAMAFAVLNLGVYIGQIGGLIGGAAIAEMAGWRTAFYALGLPGVILGLLAFITVREPARGCLDEANDKPEENRTFAEVIAALWQSRTYVFMSLGAALGGFAGYGFGYWGPTLFSRAFELTQTDANTRFGVFFGLSGLFGALLMGFVCDRLTVKNPRWPFILSSVGVVGSMTFMICTSLTDNIGIATALAVPAGLLGGGWVVALQAALQDLLPGETRATGTSIWAFALTFTGLVGGVQFAGFMIDFLQASYGTAAIRYALSLTLLACIPSGIFIMLAGVSFADDRKALLKNLRD